MIKTKEALEKTGLSTYKFRKVVEELQLSPTRKRGELSYKWTEEQINLISDFSKIFFVDMQPIDEMALIEYYLDNKTNIHQLSQKFNVNYHTVYVIIKRFEKNTELIINSKMNEYD